MMTSNITSFMSIASTMNQNDDGNDEHGHDNDMVMPGFRFHPTEEELIEFYLRRKVEGKRFNVELITLLDLYRYDPWELPAMAAIGEKEWFFYVPRDRKYRNGDRPNRVTTSGYWKATGADRMIRSSSSSSENFRSIGLKKTLVFYSGKAPKGVRTSWIMNEYRLPHHETQRLLKTEISLCRVYKRAGIEDHPSVPRSLPTRASSSRSATHLGRRQHGPANSSPLERSLGFGGQSQLDEAEKMSETSGSSSTEASKPNSSYISLASISSSSLAPPDHRLPLMDQSEDQACGLIPNNCSANLVPQNEVGGEIDLHRLMNFQQASVTHPSDQFSIFQPSQSFSAQAVFSGSLWDWSSIAEENKDFIIHFK